MLPPRPEDHEEQVLVRRVVTALCGILLLTVPFVDVAFGGSESWVVVARLAIFGVAFALLGRTRLRTAEVVLGVAVLMWVVTLVGVGRATAGVVAGTREGAGLGSAALWLAAGISPALFIALPLRRALRYCTAGVVAVFTVMLVIARAEPAVVLGHAGVGQVMVSTVLVIGVAAMVARLAGRRAEERRRAQALQQERAATAARLVRNRRRREELFSRTATALHVPMAELAAAVGPLRTATPDAVDADRAILDRVRQLSEALLERIVALVDELVLRIQAEDAAEADPLVEAVPPPEPDAAHPVTTGLLAVGVLGLVGLDTWRVSLLNLGDVHATAAAANRMIVVLFVAAAVLVVRFPGRVGWVLTGLAMLAHPFAIFAMAGEATRASVVMAFGAPWRVTVMAAGLLALLAVIIERRVRDRDAFVAEAGQNESRTAELRRHERTAELAYAEAAHELKTPLSIILGSARTLMTYGGRAQPDQVAALRTALVRGVDRLDARLSVMREVAMVAPTGPEGLPRPLQPVIAADVLLGALASARVPLTGRAVDIDVQLSDERTIVRPGDVEHVLENLLTNADKYGDPEVAIRLTAHRADDAVVVEVANRGGTLTSRDAMEMFEPYWRAAAVEGDVAGSGLGLAVVARLVAGWGGRCRARVGDGWTRVVFTMPVAGDQAQTTSELSGQVG